MTATTVRESISKPHMCRQRDEQNQGTGPIGGGNNKCLSFALAEAERTHLVSPLRVALLLL
jgi:hypothetical protein